MTEKEKEKAIDIIKNIIDYNSVQSWGKALRYAVKELEEKLTSDNSDYAKCPQCGSKGTFVRNYFQRGYMSALSLREFYHKYGTGMPNSWEQCEQIWNAATEYTLENCHSTQQTNAKITCYFCGSPCVRIKGESEWVKCRKCGELHRK